MENKYIFKFKSDISNVDLPISLNNPFDSFVPEIAKIAAVEFSQFINEQHGNWSHDFSVDKGKMFGVIVIEYERELAYMGTVSGRLKRGDECDRFVPSPFDESTDDFFINKGMTELTEIGNRIKSSQNQEEIEKLKAKRSQKSNRLQQRLFENYRFTNITGNEKNVIEIFETSSHGNPPAASGECAGPKLLQFAFENNLKPIALTEFWYGNPPRGNERQHGDYYPACKNKCRPILEFMLDDFQLFEEKSAV